MKTLLHICCAPCAIYTVKRLRQIDGISLVEGFFYNPNIHPVSEYNNRRASVEKLSESFSVKVNYFREYEFEDFFRKINLHEGEERCSLCWSLRINKAAEYASKNGFDSFTSTLLISPYQDHEEIKKIAAEAASKYSVLFLYEDLRKGFAESQKFSKDMELYRQKYCGCIYSERERFEKVK